MRDLTAGHLSTGLPLDHQRVLAIVSTWPQDWQDQFHERAAILEVCGYFAYVSAISRAYQMVFEDLRREGLEPGYSGRRVIRR